VLFISILLSRNRRNKKTKHRNFDTHKRRNSFFLSIYILSPKINHLSLSLSRILEAIEKKRENKE